MPPLGSFVPELSSPLEGLGVGRGVVEEGSPCLLSFSPPVLEGSGGSEDEELLSFPPLLSPPPLSPLLPVGTGREGVGDTAGEVLLVEAGRESVGEVWLTFPPLSLPLLEEPEVDETGGDEREELGILEEELSEGTVEDVESTGGVEESGTLLLF